jgi:hypothetical protein
MHNRFLHFLLCPAVISTARRHSRIQYCCLRLRFRWSSECPSSFVLDVASPRSIFVTEEFKHFIHQPPTLFLALASPVPDSLVNARRIFNRTTYTRRQDLGRASLSCHPRSSAIRGAICGDMETTVNGRCLVRWSIVYCAIRPILSPV